MEGARLYPFFAMLSRMKYINRWGLMRNTRSENICEHSLEVALIAHALATVGNQKFGKSYNPPCWPCSTTRRRSSPGTCPRR
jgi:5'-deoxynucleotidase YfbR-like HD superfamily hydrolase